MRIKLTAIFVLFFLTDRIYSQGKDNGFYVKATINEISSGYEGFIKPNKFFSCEAGYRFSYFNEWHLSGNVLPVEYLYKFLCFHGPTFRFTPLFKMTNRYFVGPVLGYQYLVCDKLINDLGGYAGASDDAYQVWEQFNNEIVMQVMNQLHVGKDKCPLYFYCAVGYKYCFVQQNFSIDGTGSHKTPSDKIVYSGNLAISIVIGMKIDLVKL